MPAVLSSPEFKALSARQHKKLAALLAAGASPNQVNAQGQSLVYQACQSEQPQALSVLLTAGADPNTWTQDGKQALHEAMRHNDLASVQTLLDAGADPTTVRQTTRTWSSAMYQGAIMGAQACLELLASRFAGRLDWDLGTQHDVTPLMGAVRNDKTETACWLIEQGAQLEAPAGDRGATALVHACARALPSMVEMLLEKGANPNAVTIDGMNALHHLAQINESGIIPLAHRLIEAGTDVLALNHHQQTPFQMFDRTPSHRDTPLHRWWKAQDEKAHLRIVATAEAPEVSARMRARL